MKMEGRDTYQKVREREGSEEGEDETMKRRGLKMEMETEKEES